MDVDKLIDALIEREGGFVSHPKDRGGPTRYGITEASRAPMAMAEQCASFRAK